MPYQRLKTYHCPQCKTPVAISADKPGAICRKCGRAVLREDVERQPQPMRLYAQPAFLLALAVAMGIAVVLYAPSLLAGFGLNLGAVAGVDAINTANYANTRLEYYYYIPASVVGNKQETYPLLVMMPGLSGRGQDFITQDFKNFANDQKFIIAAPSFIFDEQNWAAQTSYQYPAAWSGEALLKIINQLQAKNGLKTSKLYLFGFSAGAQFALRFCLWQPARCAASAAHGSGGTVQPTQKINVKFFVTVGNQDTSRIEMAKVFYNAARSLGIDVRYKEYAIGHSLTGAQISDSLEFFKSVK